MGKLLSHLFFLEIKLNIYYVPGHRCQHYALPHATSILVGRQTEHMGNELGFQSYYEEKDGELRDMDLVTRQKTQDRLVSASSFTAMTCELRAGYEPGWGEEWSRQREYESEDPEQKKVDTFKEGKRVWPKPCPARGRMSKRHILGAL